MENKKAFMKRWLADRARWLKTLLGTGKEQLAACSPVNPAVQAAYEHKLHSIHEDVVQNWGLANYRTTFETIVAVLEARDPYTANHSQRVADMTLRLCIAANLSPMQARVYTTAAAIHDIGKVGISDAVLRKEGRLDDAEWAEIKRHPGIGADILAKNEGLLGVANAVRHHHERWDGKGYPGGLAGEDIPLASRVIAVCDSMDAMLTDRPYRRGLAKDICRAEIEKNRGVMYDPALANACLANWDYMLGDAYGRS